MTEPHLTPVALPTDMWVPKQAQHAGFGLRMLEANGTTFGCLHLADIDDLTKPLALLLHGFPDSAWTWRHLMPALSAAGFRPVAHFQRGYAPSAVPSDGLFQTAALSVDANALHVALGGDSRAVLVGHDWGAAGVPGAVNTETEKWARCVIMSVPPGGVMGKAFTDPQQLKRSWYMFFFQHFLSDVVVPANDLAFIDMLWADWSPGYDASDDLPGVKAALRDPANLTAALGYYRASLGSGLRSPNLAEVQTAAAMPIAIPTLYLHGATDGCISAEFASSVPAVLTHSDSRVVVVPDAGHFLQLEQPAEVNRLIVEFLAS